MSVGESASKLLQLELVIWCLVTRIVHLSVCQRTGLPEPFFFLFSFFILPRVRAKRKRKRRRCVILLEIHVYTAWLKSGTYILL